MRATYRGSQDRSTQEILMQKTDSHFQQPTQTPINPVKKDGETQGQRTGLGEAFAPPKTGRHMADFLRARRLLAA